MVLTQVASYGFLDRGRGERTVRYIEGFPRGALLVWSGAPPRQVEHLFKTGMRGEGRGHELVTA
jgi:hypothetical protein